VEFRLKFFDAGEADSRFRTAKQFVNDLQLVATAKRRGFRRVLGRAPGKLVADLRKRLVGGTARHISPRSPKKFMKQWLDGLIEKLFGCTRKCSRNTSAASKAAALRSRKYQGGSMLC
jgi:hypothetical protein